MRRFGLTILLASLALAVPASGQDPETKPQKPPAKGDTVVVRGCVSGSSLQSYETRKLDDTGTLTAPITYRLTGKKEIVRQLRTAHANHIENVTGILKSTLPDGLDTRGRQIGKSRIFIGVAQPSRGGPPAPPVQHLPVLEVTSFAHVSGNCGR